MSVLKKLLQNKQSRSSLITATLSFLLMISIVIASFQITAWFKNHHTVDTPGAITNFAQTVQYKTGSTWVSVEHGKGIPVSVSKGSFTPVTVRVQHTGKSAASIRVSAFGSFSNADTGTVLPLFPSDSWVLTSAKNSSKWIKNDGDFHLYYNDDFYTYNANGVFDFTNPPVDNTNPVIAVKNPTAVYTEEFTVSLDPDSFNTSSISAHQEYTGELFIIVDAVQPDRESAFW